MKVKKIIFLLYIGLLLFGLVACKSTTATKIKPTTNTEKTKTTTDVIDKKEKASINKKVVVKIEDIPVEIIMPEPGSTSPMKAVYTNNSNYSISNMQITVLSKGSIEETYFLSHTTALSGEVSSTFESMGTVPASGELKDVEILQIDYQIETDDEPIFVYYDAKLKEYDVF